MEDIKTKVVNAKHIKAIPGRKTDANDAEWVATFQYRGDLFIRGRCQMEPGWAGIYSQGVFFFFDKFLLARYILRATDHAPSLQYYR